MKRKIIVLLLTLTLAFSTTACGTQSTTNTPDESISETDSSVGNSEDITESRTLDSLEANVMKDVENSVLTLKSEMETLVAEVDSFNKYVENADRMESFYTNVCNDSSLLRICLMEHAVIYAEFIMNSDEDFDDKYDNLDELYDIVYEDAGDAFYDSIYDGILEDMYDVFYDELLDDAYDTVPYAEWLNARSNEYEWWLEARSDTYEIWLDTRSDIYEFWLDLRSAAFEKDANEVTEIIDNFKENIENLKSSLRE